MRIIGLLGAAGTGKSTVAAHLEKKYGARRYSFADPLKRLAMATMDFTREQCYGTQAEKEAIDPRYGFSPRWFLQRLGTNGCRHVFGENFWTARTFDLIRNDCPELAVIEDVRFISEAMELEDIGGEIWRLECPDAETTADATHPSEREWRDAPYNLRIAAPRSEGARSLLTLVDLEMRRGR